MSEFASSVFLGDLNDFITPAQACVNPLFAPSATGDGETAKGKNTENGDGLPKIGLVIENDTNAALQLMQPEPVSVKPDLIKKTETNTAQVSLSDCLACSGCVTSAETVLIEQQSKAEFLASLQDRSKYDHFVVTISTQTLASLAAHLDCSVEQCAEVTKRFLADLGIDAVLDLSTAGDIALLEIASEFVHRKRNPEEAGWKKPMVSKAESKSEVTWYSESGEQVQAPLEELKRPLSLPMLSSECPGWICFVEKTHPEAISYVSTAMSPQQVSGVLVKTLLAERKKWTPSRIYHCSIMPCPDKKLEASRRDFFDQSISAADVDCVLTTNELLELMQERNCTNLNAFGAMMEVEEDDVVTQFSSGQLVTSTHSDGGSGGYLEFVFRFAAKELYDVTIPDGPLPFKQGKNADIKSVSLQVGGERVLNFAAAYGFRNIQSIIRQMKRGRCPYDFVEIMACPGGCLNGGGQVKINKGNDSVATPMDKRQLLESTKLKLSGSKVRAPLANRAVGYIYESVLHAHPYSEPARNKFHTRLHAVPKLQNPLMQAW